DGDAAETGFGEGVATDVVESDGAVAGDGADPLGDLGGFDGAERGFQLDAAVHGAHGDFAVVGFGVERAGDVVELERAERIADGDGGAGDGAALNATIVSDA